MKNKQKTHNLPQLMLQSCREMLRHCQGIHMWFVNHIQKYLRRQSSLKGIHVCLLSVWCVVNSERCTGELKPTLSPFGPVSPFTPYG